MSDLTTPAQKYDQELAIIEAVIRRALQQLAELRDQVYQDLPEKKSVDVETVFPKDF